MASPKVAIIANQTIEDAIVLADCLAGADDIAPALRAYEERRRNRTARVQRWSRRAVDLMHLPDGPQIAPRDALFRELDSELAWIHAYDARREGRGGPGWHEPIRSGPYPLRG